MSLVNSTKDFNEDNEKDDTEHEVGDDDNHSNTDVHNNDTEEMAGIPEITTKELQTVINKLKKRQIPRQQWKSCRRHQSLRRRDERNCEKSSTRLLRERNFTPEDWKKVTIKVIHKKGDVENVSNYRPICSLLASYKLFSTILYGRLYPVLDQKQAEDQAGFRKFYQTKDYFATYRLIEQKCHEWRIKMWTASVDFTKAFDSISHKSIRKALKACDIKHHHISLLKKIYKDQKASVQTDEESNIFEIRKGTKQGDPLSSLLFNTVLQYSLKDDCQRWQMKKGMEIHLSDHDRDCLTNLKFADDVMLFATSKEQIRKMLCEFNKATEKVGHRIHPDKAKILSNKSTINSDTKKHIEVGDMNIEILTRNESVKYLGQRISFYQQETIEIKSRIRAAWATFHKYRQELTSKKYMLKHRLRLFDATISPTVCYAAGTWAPNKEHERMIQSTQRKMLRFIIQTKKEIQKD